MKSIYTCAIFLYCLTCSQAYSESEEDSLTIFPKDMIDKLNEKLKEQGKQCDVSSINKAEFCGTQNKEASKGSFYPALGTICIGLVVYFVLQKSNKTEEEVLENLRQKLHNKIPELDSTAAGLDNFVDLIQGFYDAKIIEAVDKNNKEASVAIGTNSTLIEIIELLSEKISAIDELKKKKDLSVNEFVNRIVELYHEKYEQKMNEITKSTISIQDTPETASSASTKILLDDTGANSEEDDIVAIDYPKELIDTIIDGLKIKIPKLFHEKDSLTTVDQLVETIDKLFEEKYDRDYKAKKSKLEAEVKENVIAEIIDEFKSQCTDFNANELNDVSVKTLTESLRKHYENKSSMERSSVSDIEILDTQISFTPENFQSVSSSSIDD